MKETLPATTEEILPATTEEDFMTEETLPTTAEEEVTVTMEEEVTVPVEQNVTEKKWWKESKDKIISWMAAKDKWLIEMRGNLRMVATVITIQNVVNPPGGVNPPDGIRPGQSLLAENFRDEYVLFLKLNFNFIPICAALS